jgi:O-antigen/teichoic acid export membrane protein
VPARSLSVNFGWALVGTVCYAASQWLFLVILAKRVSPSVVGEFSLGLAVANPIIMFSNLQLRGIQATDARNRFTFPEYFQLRSLSTVGALLVVALVAGVGPYALGAAVVIVLAGFARAAESMSDIVYGLLQRHERLDRVGQSMLLRGLVAVLGVALILPWVPSAAGAAFALALTWLLLFAFFDTRAARTVLRASGKERFLGGWSRASRLRELALLGLPLGIATTLVSFNVSVPRYFVHHHLGDHELGIFAALAYSAIGGATVIAALGQAATPCLASYFADGDRRAFWRLLLLMTSCAAVVGAAAVVISLVAGRRILEIVYRPEYSKSTDVFTWILVGAGISYLSSVVGYGLIAVRYFRAQTVVCAIGLAATIIGCNFLVPTLGSKGAAFALVASASAALVTGGLALGHALIRAKWNEMKTAAE